MAPPADLLTLCGYTPADAGAGKLSELPLRLKALGEEQAADKLGVGLPTLQDRGSRAHAARAGMSGTTCPPRCCVPTCWR